MNWILSFIFILILLQVGALIYLVVQKQQRANQEQSRQQWQMQFREDLYTFAMGERTDMPLVKKGYEDLVELELFAFTNLTATESYLERIHQFVEISLSAYYDKQIEHRRIDRRLNAYEAIAQFRLQSVADHLQRRLAENVAKEERDVIIRTLVSISPRYAIAAAKTDQDMSFFGAVLAVGRSHDLSIWVEEFEGLTRPFQMALLQLIHDRDETQYLELVRSKTTDEHPEIRKRALRALTRIGLEEDWTLYVPYLQEDTSWVEQMLALRFLENVGRQEALPSILPFVSSRSWWVRTAAFDALLACGGLQQLAIVAKTHPDRYAKQKATERLAKEMKQHVI